MNAIIDNRNNIKAPIFAISRLRFATDGPGITTLVTFMGCPLKCKYCINKMCHKPIYEEDKKAVSKGVMMLTPQELYEKVKLDIFRHLVEEYALEVENQHYIQNLLKSLKSYVTINGKSH